MHHGGGGGGNQGGTQPCLWELEEEKRQQLYVQYYEVTFSHQCIALDSTAQEIFYMAPTAIKLCLQLIMGTFTILF